MTKRNQKKIILLYQVFAIFSLFFQSFLPALSLAVPAYAGNEATESADLDESETYEDSAKINLETQEETIGSENSEESEDVADGSEDSSEAVDEDPNEDAEAEEAKTDETETAGEEETKDQSAEEAEDQSEEDSNSAEAEDTNEVDESEEQSAPAFYVDYIIVGETYVFTDSLGQEVQLTFTWIDEEVGARTLTINELKLSEEEQEEMGAVSEVAYDITSSMPNGSFTYDLSMRLNDDTDSESVEVKYADSPETLAEAKDVDGEEKLGNMVSVKGLNHFTVFVVTNSSPASSDSYCVNASSTSDCYETIQEAINAADPSDGVDTILVESGTYAEALNVNKEVIITGEDEATTFIDTTGLDDGYCSPEAAICITADGVTFENFTILGDTTNTDISRAVKVSGADGVVLENLMASEMSGSAFDVINSNDVTITNVTSYDNLNAGLFFSNVNGATVSNISTSGNGWGPMGIATNCDYAPCVVDNFVITGTNALSGPIWLESNNGGSIPTFGYTASADVQVLPADFEYAMGGELSSNSGAVPQFVLFQDLSTALVAGGTDGSSYHHENGTKYVFGIDTPDFYVGPGMDIQDAVNAASDDDSIHVYPGTYNEEVCVDKSLDITGVNADGNPAYTTESVGAVGGPVIDGAGATSCIGGQKGFWLEEVADMNVSVTGFTFRNQYDVDATNGALVGWAPSGALGDIVFNYNTIEDSTIRPLFVGYSNSVTAQYNLIDAPNSYVLYPLVSNSVVISNNDITVNEQSADFMGILSGYVKDTTIVDNSIVFTGSSSNELVGILLYNSTTEQANISGNYINGNEVSPDSIGILTNDFSDTAAVMANENELMNLGVGIENQSDHTLYACDNIYSGNDTDEFENPGAIVCPDSAAPTITDTKMFVNGVEGYLTKPGDTVKIQVTVEDDESGVDRVQLWVREYPWSPNHNEITSGDMTNVSPGVFEFTFTVPESYVDGDPLNEAFEGNYFNFRPWDSAGNSHIGWRTNFTIDDTAPSTPTGLTIKNHEGEVLGCSGFTNNRTILIDWDDNLSAEGIAYYQYDIKDNIDFRHYEESETGYGQIRDEDGLYRYRVWAIDEAGNKSDPTDWCEVTLDRELPAAPTIELPDQEQYFNSKPILNDWTDVTTDLSGIDYYEVEYVRDSDGQILYREEENSQRNHTPNEANQTGFTIRVRAVDNAGNVGPWSNAVHYYYDNSAPIVDITNPTVGHVNGVVDIRGSVNDANPHHYYLAIFNDSGNNVGGPGTVNDASSFTDQSLFSWDTANGSYPDGEYTIRLSSRDAADNKDGSGSADGDSVKNITVMVDNTDPESTITPPEGSVETDDNTVVVNDWDGTIAGEATDNLSGVEKVQISILNDSTNMYWDPGTADFTSSDELLFDSNSLGGTPFAWDYAIPEPTEGSYTITSHAVDNAGNEEQTATLTIIYDKTISEVSLTMDPAENDGDRGWYQTQPTITLTATDPADTIQYQWNGTEDGEWQEYTGPIEPGQGNNQFYYRAVDLAGNESEPGTKTILFDEEVPGDVENYEIERNGDEAILTWDDASDNIGIHGYEIIWENDELDIRRSESVGSNVNEFTISDLEDGEWTVRVRTEDLAGWTNDIGQEVSVVDGQVAGVTTEVEVFGDGTGGPLQFLSSAVGDVLGAGDDSGDNDSQEKAGSDEIAQADGMAGQVAGAETECSPWQFYLPIILLLVQLMALAAVELFVRSSTVAKTITDLLITGIIIIVAYLYGNANCYSTDSTMSMINSWFWLLSLLLGFAMRALGLLFIEEN